MNDMLLLSSVGMQWETGSGFLLGPRPRKSHFMRDQDQQRRSAKELRADNRRASLFCVCL
jgi:hypothetical protein